MNLKLGIAGDRYWSDWGMFNKTVTDYIEKYPNMISELATGDSSGTDTMVYDYAVANGIPYTIYCASRHNWMRLVRDGANAVLCSDWKTDGKLAGPRRNIKLVRSVDMILLFDGGGKGSRSVKKLAERVGRPIEVWMVDSEKEK